MGVGVYQAGDNGASGAIENIFRGEVSFQFSAHAHRHDLFSFDGSCAVIDHLAIIIHSHNGSVRQKPVNRLRLHRIGPHPFVSRKIQNKPGAN
jgi:hypothetical protein